MKKNLQGRPPMICGKRTKKIDVRFTEAEFELVLHLEKTLGLSRADLIRDRVLKDSVEVIVNAEQMIAALDLLGTEMGRSGNNINQLARYANTLTRQGILSVVVVERYNLLLENYRKVQKHLELLMRKLIRLTRK